MFGADPEVCHFRRGNFITSHPNDTDHYGKTYSDEQWRFWIALVTPLLLIIQFIGNVKSYFRSKRNERVISNAINHTMNTQYTIEFTVEQLMNDTGIDKFYEVQQIFTNAKRNGNITHTAILTE